MGRKIHLEKGVEAQKFSLGSFLVLFISNFIPEERERRYLFTFKTEVLNRRGLKC